MSDFTYRPQRLRLLDAQLTLDPEVVAMMAEIEAKLAARQMVEAMLRPNWRLVLPDFESILKAPRPDVLTLPSTPGGVPVPYPNAPGPATPRAGELSDVIGAVYKLPVVQGLVTRAHDEGLRQLRLLRTEWKEAPTSERVLMVTMSTIVASGFIVPIIASQETRDLAFGLIKGRTLPVPGVDGLSFKLLDRGGSVTAPLGVPGLSGSLRLQFPNSAAPDYEAMIMFDVMTFAKSRGAK